MKGPSSSPHNHGTPPLTTHAASTKSSYCFDSAVRPAVHVALLLARHQHRCYLLYSGQRVSLSSVHQPPLSKFVMRSLLVSLPLVLSVLLMLWLPVPCLSHSISRSPLRRLLASPDVAADESVQARVDVPRVAAEASNSSGNYSNCSACELLTEYIAPFVRSGSTVAVVEQLAFAYCVVVEYGKDCHSVAQCSDLCSGIISEFGPLVLNILANTSLTAQELCFDIALCPPPTAPVPGVAVPSNVSDMRGQKQWPMWQHTSGSGTFVHLSDLHFDTLYSLGSSTECGLDLCCRAAWTVPGNTSGVAGMFGDYKCDSPPVLVQSVLELINVTLTPRPDFILYTGDDPAHDVWHQNRTTNLAAIASVSAALLRYFPDIPVLSAIGNHEAAPVNQFGGPGIDSWLYEALVLDWAYYLPDDAQQTLSYGGYYAALVRPGLYVLSINTNIYTSDDYYTRYEMVDLTDQLDWLNDHHGADRAAGLCSLHHHRPLIACRLVRALRRPLQRTAVSLPAQSAQHILWTHAPQPGADVRGQHCQPAAHCRLHWRLGYALHGHQPGRVRVLVRQSAAAAVPRH